MTDAATIDIVHVRLADPTRRHRSSSGVVRSDEITVGELTRGSGVTQGAISQHLKSLSRRAWSPNARRAQTSITG